MMYISTATPQRILADAEAIFNQLLAETDDTIRPKIHNKLCNNSFPPSNILIDKDNNYVIELACAGYEEKDIEVSYEDKSIFVELQSNASAEKTEGHWLQRGIRVGKSESRYYLPDKYDGSKIKASLKNGMLRLVVPIKEDKAPLKIKLN